MEQVLAPPARRTASNVAVKKSSARIPCAWDRRNSAQPGPSRRRVDPGALEDLPDRGRCHRDAEPGELAVDPPVSPRLVLPGQPQHRRPHLAMCCRAPEAAPAQQPPHPQPVLPARLTKITGGRLRLNEGTAGRPAGSSSCPGTKRRARRRGRRNMISNHLTTNRYDKLVITTRRTWEMTLSYFAASPKQGIRD
jgi:hypothetical protein